ncbi:MAG: hypothetical protein ACYS8X_00820 [Planctomycetota bacterium]|jgi:hypothetical protein
MKRTICLIGLLCASLPAGCDMWQYHLDLTPRGNQLERKLTAEYFGEDEWELPKETGPKLTVPPAEVKAETERLSNFYATRLESDDIEKIIFTGKFSGAMPNDIGGAGQYVTYPTRMGTAFAYIERFRGNDAPAALIQEAFDSTNLLVAFLSGWLKQELSDQPDLPQLLAFLDEQLRTDLKNLAVYHYLGTYPVPDADGLSMENVGRMAQYLIEREYVSAKQLPKLFRDIKAVDDKDDKDLLSAVRPMLLDILQRKVEMKDKTLMVAVSGLLTDWPSVKESMSIYMMTDEFQKKLGVYEEKRAAREAEQEDAPDSDDTPSPSPAEEAPATEEEDGDDTPDEFGPGDMFKDLLESMSIASGPFLDDKVAATLHNVPKPGHTNGHYDEKNRTVSWPSLSMTSEGRLPVIFFAYWAEPAEAFQQDRFGKVIVAGNDLWQYCLWRQSLSDEEAAEWEAAIDAFRPGDEASLVALKAFRFSGEPAPAEPAEPTDGDEEEEGPPTYAKTAIGLIMGKLESKESPAEPSP